MVFQTLGEQYGQDGWFKTALNSALIYTGLRVGGTVIDRLTGSPTIDTLLDMAAPVATGIYCVSRGPEGALGNTARLGIAGLVGWDIADQLIRYPGSYDIFDSTRNALQNTYNAVKGDLPAMINSPEVFGGALGVVSSTVYQFIQGVRRGRQARAAATAARSRGTPGMPRGGYGP